MVGGERRTEVNGRRVNESVEHLILMSSCPLKFIIITAFYT